MTARYLLLTGRTNSRLLEMPTTLAGLPLVRSSENLLLAAGAGDLATDPDAEIAVVGKLFSRIDNRPIQQFDGAAREEIIRSKGQWLLDHCWGAYVAVIAESGGRASSVIRDPSGMLACYHCAVGDGCVAITNEPELLSDAGLVSWRVGWAALARHLRSGDFRGTHTCLEGLHELLPGCRLTLGAQREMEPVWSPWAHVGPDQRLQRESAAALLSRTVVNCVTAWARSYDQILMGISGGLDSSIVLAALKSAHVKPSLYTLATKGPGGDERAYARLAAEHCGFAVAEQFFDISAVDPGRSHAAHLPRPTGNYFIQAIEAAVKGTLARMHRDSQRAIFSGGGGDNIFCYAHSASPVADRWLREGFAAGLFATARDIHRVTGASLPAIVTKALGKRWGRDKGYRWKGDDLFIATAVEAEPLSFNHPWLDTPDDALPGKALHIALLLRFHNHLERHRRPDFPPTIMPLLSQPIAELCISIPSWRWYEGAVNRSVARQAFADRLPEALIRRTSKGRPDSFILEIFEHHRALLREMLHDGLLRRHGIIDMEAIDTVLKSANPHHRHQLRVLELGNAEAWARKWSA
jgi:asparagine synthase (glutamine-hydrolysing)